MISRVITLWVVENFAFLYKVVHIPFLNLPPPTLSFSNYFLGTIWNMKELLPFSTTALTTQWKLWMNVCVCVLITLDYLCYIYPIFYLKRISLVTLSCSQSIHYSRENKESQSSNSTILCTTVNALIGEVLQKVQEMITEWTSQGCWEVLVNSYIA